MRARSLLAILAFAVVALAWGATPGRAAASDPASFMGDLGTHLLHIITDKSAPEAQRRQQFRELGEQAFDIPKIARFVLGRYWRSANDDQKKQFSAAFENYMLNIYWTRFTGYNGETFKVTGSRNEGNGTIVVTTQILRPSGQPPVSVDWSVVKVGDDFKIEDASLEGVSQALTYRDEFSSIIERNGGQLSALIDQLNERAKEG
ncbi:MAG TPA: ABC transporter substrate-binding protein [Stellaceae bacterium]|nr:ABC transporter substrate-binding protein [Stellaceae bacterium]